MDKQLLKALDNLSLSLEMIADVLASKGEEGQSSTTTALQSGNFVKTLEEINVGVKSLKVDTEKILKNQQTIIDLQKKKESDKKTGVAEDVGVSKEQESNIKKGAATIMLIALAVLAIGLAFKLVGSVDFLSVVGLSIAIMIMAIAFEKVAKLGLSLKEAAITSGVLVMIALAITISSWIMKMITPISMTQFLTATFIAVTFAAMSKYLENIFIATLVFSKLKVSPFALIQTLVSISVAITASSWIMQLITPISLGQGMTAVLISLIFSLIGYNLHKIALSVAMFKKVPGVKPMDLVWVLLGISTAITVSSWILQLLMPLSFSQLVTAILISAMFLIISFNLEKIAMGVVAFKKTGVKATDLLMVLVGIAAAITVSSWVLNMIMPIGLWQFVTALGITLMFAIMSYIMPELALGIAIIEKTLGSGKVWLIPVVMLAISLAIMLSSHILAFTAPIPFVELLRILAMSVILSIAVVVVGLAFFIINKLGGPGSYMKGGISILIIAGVIALSSHILSWGKYEKYPSLDWTLGVGLAFLAFGVSLVALGLVAMTGVGAAAFFIGIPMVLAMSGTILAVSKILDKGKYELPGFLEWAKGVSLLFATFTPILLVLGAVGLANAVVSFFGPDPWKMAKTMILEIARTIVGVSFILSKGNWKKGPTKEWAEGVSIAIGAFAPVYAMLVESSIFKAFGIGGVGPKEFNDAIRTVVGGIIFAANEFANNSVAFKNGPSERWARGVGQAIGAFAPVYKVLAANSGWFASGVSVKDMKSAIMTISEGIVDAAKFFAKNTAPFDEGKYPSEKWGKGVGAALSAFAPVFKSLSEDSGWFTSGKDVINDMVYAVKRISESIVYAAKKFGKVSPDVWDSYPKLDWANSLSYVVRKYLKMSNYISSYDDIYGNLRKTRNVAESIVRVAKILYRGRKEFGLIIDPNYMKNMSQNMLDFNELVRKLVESESQGSSLIGGMGSKISDMFGNDPISQIANRMVILAKGYDAMATALIKLSMAMKLLNVNSVKELGGLTRSIVLKNPELENINKESEFSRKNMIMSSVNTDKPKSTKLPPGMENKNSISYVSKKLDELVTIMKNIDRNTNTIDEAMEELTGSKIKAAPEKSEFS